VPPTAEAWNFGIARDQILVLDREGDLHSIPLAGTESQKVVARLGPVRSARLFVRPDGEALVVDKAEARLCKISPANGRTEWKAVEHADVTSSREYLRTRRQSDPSVAPKTIDQVPLIGACGISPRRRFYFLVQPVLREKGGVVLVSGIAGRVEERHTLALSGRELRPLLPRWLEATESALFTISGDGHVDEYALS